MLSTATFSTNVPNSKKLDKLAIFLSAVCLFHCLLTPTLITLLPVIFSSHLVNDELFHQLLLWFVLPTSVLALFLGCRNHKQLSIIGTGIVGISILVAVAVLGHDFLSRFAEKIVTSAGGIVLALTHFLNYRACLDKRCRDDHCSASQVFFNR